jgi:transcriptional regulator with XRE-family HTH domain
LPADYAGESCGGTLERRAVIAKNWVAGGIFPRSRGELQEAASGCRRKTKRHWTLEDLTRFSRMNATYLGVLERGLNMPTLATILQLAEVFGVDAARAKVISADAVRFGAIDPLARASHPRIGFICSARARECDARLRGSPSVDRIHATGAHANAPSKA